MAELGRRAFLKGTGAVTWTALFGGVLLQACGRGTPTAAEPPVRSDAGGYGPLARVADQRGVEVLALPAGFTYVTFGATGSVMSDGTPTPRNLDGMSAFPGPDGTVRLIRNHENGNVPGLAEGGVQGPAGSSYDRAAFGGTTTLDFDPRRGVLVRDFVSLHGSKGNCSGGRVLGGTAWLSCEETLAGPEQDFEQKHGYCFLVPASASAPVTPVPLVAMGRFTHEAVAEDPTTGFIYETEDPGNDRSDKSGFYRFQPEDPARLDAGGTLSMLAIRDRERYDTTLGQTLGRELPVTWITIDDPDPDLESNEDTVFDQGRAAGGARFSRLEGLCFDPIGHAFFLSSTNGGNARYGQIWRYDPRAETLTLFFESPGGSALDSPDNLVATPGGCLLVCEDDSTGADTSELAPGIDEVNRLVGLTPEGRAFDFVVNCLNDAELSGVCFSPDGSTLFLNVYGDRKDGSGMTCAITGPCASGVL